MSGLSTIINSTAGAINGFRDQQYQQNQQDYLQAVRANDELKMQAAQQTYQPQAQAQVAAAGLSQAQANSATSLVPAQTNLASTNLGTAQSAASAAQARQPVLNDTADNQAAVQQGFSSAQHDMLPMTLADFKAKGVLEDQTQHVAAFNGLYNSMMAGADSAKQYVQKMADAGFYLPGKQIGQVGLSQDGQNFVIQDPQGNMLTQFPVSAIQQAHALSVPTEWHAVGDTLMGTQGGRVTATQSAPQFKSLRPGETGVIQNGNSITNATQAPVPPELVNQHSGVTVNTAQWLMKNIPGIKPQDAFNMAKQANTMSREQFVSTILGNPMLNTDMRNPGAQAQKYGQIYDALRAQQSVPGLSNAPASNTSGNSIIDSLIGGGAANNPTTTIDNPYYQPDQ
jgi:hypothetical protein